MEPGRATGRATGRDAAFGDPGRTAWDGGTWRVLKFGLRPMLGRDPHERGRAASTLELFFDLVFTVAISLSSDTLFEMESAGGLVNALCAYLLTFFTIWWAWVCFTWFASSFDTDDWLYRVCTIIQMAGVLVLAAGLPRALTSLDFTLVTWGYVVMRLALVFQWGRVAVTSPRYRAVAVSQAVGISTVQVLWVLRLDFVRGAWPVEVGTFLLLAALELSVPFAAQGAADALHRWKRRHHREASTPVTRFVPWHAHHVAERYSLFTIIVLGESIVSIANAVIDAVKGNDNADAQWVIGGCGLILAAGMWWVYFARYQRHRLTTLRRATWFGYLHYGVLASLGAFSAGIEVLVRKSQSGCALSETLANATVSVPVLAYLAIVAWFSLRPALHLAARWAVHCAFALVAVSPLLPGGLLWTTAGVVAIVVTVEIARCRQSRGPAPAGDGSHAAGPAR